MLKDNWGEIIKKRREQLGLSQEEVARVLGKTRNHIHNLETQKRPPKAHELGIIASVLGLDISTLYENGNVTLSISRLIQAARLSKNIDMGDLARATGIDFFRLGNAELGEVELLPDELDKIAEVLDIDFSRFAAVKQVSIANILDMSKELGLPETKILLLKQFLEDCVKNDK